MSALRRPLRPWRSLSLGLSVLGLALAGCQSSGPQSRPAPPAFSWVPTAAPGVTAQQAFAASFQPLHLCASGPAAAVTYTWVVTGPTFGMAVLAADCQNDPADTRQALAFVQLGIDTPGQPRCPHWQLQGGAFGLRPPPDPPADVLAEVPTWLLLPPDRYLGSGLGGGPYPPSFVQMWESATQEFVAGRVQAKVLRPPNAQALTSAPAGWLTEEHGLASVVLPQPGGWTFFFAGTASPAQVENMARRTVSHADDLLPWPGPLPADAPAPTPAC